MKHPVKELTYLFDSSWRQGAQQTTEFGACGNYNMYISCWLREKIQSFLIIPYKSNKSKYYYNNKNKLLSLPLLSIFEKKIMFSSICLKVFDQCISDYHLQNSVKSKPKNPFENKDIKHLLYQKNWIDTVQWHLEDLIRDPKINPIDALELKRTIDHSNQKRTDLVEYIDSYFLEKYKIRYEDLIYNSLFWKII